MVRQLERVFALLPVAGAELVGLQRVEHAQDFLRAAADRQVGDVDEAHDALRIDDEGRALRDSRVRVEHAQRRRKLALEVGEHRERQVVQVLVALAPGEVHELRVDAHAVELRVTVAELLLEAPNAAISVGQTKVKSFGQKKKIFHFPASERA